MLKKFTSRVSYFVIASMLSTASISASLIPVNASAQSAVVYGDVKEDGVIDVVDAMMLKSYVLKKISVLSNPAAADVNGDGTVNSLDYLLVKQYISGKITKFPADNNNDNNGSVITVKDFESLKSAIASAKSGQTIEVASNLISCTSQIVLDKPKSGITIQAAKGFTPVFDFSPFREAAKKGSPSKTGDNYTGFRVYGGNYTIRGLIIQKAYDNGMLIKPNYNSSAKTQEPGEPNGNTVENCVFRYNGDAGLQISGSQSLEEAGIKVRPNDTTVKNCVAYRNFDILTTGGNADGFAAKLYLGTNTKFINCTSIENSDDAWDSYGIDDADVTYTNCIAFHNGDSAIFDGTYDKAKGLPEDKDVTIGKCEGNGNGFKMGSSNSKYGPQTSGVKTLVNCVAVDNIAKGFDENNGKGTINCTNGWGFGNLKGDYQLDLMTAGTFANNQAGASKNLKNPSGGTVTVNTNVPRAEFDAAIAKIRQQLKDNQMPTPVTFSWWK